MPRRKPNRIWMNLGGHSVPIEVRDPNPDDDADSVWVAMREPDAGYFDDNVHTFCEDCGAPIYHRPHRPAWMRVICVECALVRSDREREEKDHQERHKEEGAQGGSK